MAAGLCRAGAGSRADRHDWLGYVAHHLVVVGTDRRDPDREVPPVHENVPWPGSAEAARSQLEALSVEWSDLLSGLTETDLDRPLAYPWKEPRPLSIAIAWANSELMKNVAEIGNIRLLYEADGHTRR
jgi:hypothetical protein